MIKIESKLENNLFDGILVRRGKQCLNNAVYNKLNQNKVFCELVKAGKIIVLSEPPKAKEKAKPKAITAEKPDYSTLSYAELKQIVTDRGIQPKTMKKVDILEALAKQ